MNVISASRMKRWMAWLAAPLAVAAFTGCSVMNKDDCAKADWRQLGLSDASQGRGNDRLHDRRKACAKHGVSVDEAAYGLGYADGRAIYCTASRGQTLGKAGDGVPEVCQGLDHTEFGGGYQTGLRSFCTPVGGYERARSGLSYLGQCPPGTEDKVMIGMRLGKEIYDLNARLASIEEEKKKATTTMQNDKATDSERRDARRRLSDLRGEEESVRQMIGDGELRATRLR
jgi:hypothetical protein